MQFCECTTLFTPTASRKVSGPVADEIALLQMRRRSSSLKCTLISTVAFWLVIHVTYGQNSRHLLFSTVSVA